MIKDHMSALQIKNAGESVPRSRSSANNGLTFVGFVSNQPRSTRFEFFPEQIFNLNLHCLSSDATVRLNVAQFKTTKILKSYPNMGNSSIISGSGDLHSRSSPSNKQTRPKKTNNKPTNKNPRFPSPLHSLLSRKSCVCWKRTRSIRFASHCPMDSMAKQLYLFIYLFIYLFFFCDN